MVALAVPPATATAHNLPSPPAPSRNRLGGLLSPYAAVNLVQAGSAPAAAACFALASLGTALAVSFIKQETAGTGLADDLAGEGVGACGSHQLGAVPTGEEEGEGEGGSGDGAAGEAAPLMRAAAAGSGHQQAMGRGWQADS